MYGNYHVGPFLEKICPCLSWLLSVVLVPRDENRV